MDAQTATSGTVGITSTSAEQKPSGFRSPAMALVTTVILVMMTVVPEHVDTMIARNTEEAMKS